MSVAAAPDARVEVEERPDVDVEELVTVQRETGPCSTRALAA